MNVELHYSLISHFQKEGLANFLVHYVGASHDLTDRERLFAERAQDILSIIQHDYFLPPPSVGGSLTIRELIFRNYTLNLL